MRQAARPTDSMDNFVLGPPQGARMEPFASLPATELELLDAVADKGTRRLVVREGFVAIHAHVESPRGGVIWQQTSPEFQVARPYVIPPNDLQALVRANPRQIEDGLLYFALEPGDLKRVSKALFGEALRACVGHVRIAAARILDDGRAALHLTCRSDRFALSGAPA